MEDFNKRVNYLNNQIEMEIDDVIEGYTEEVNNLNNKIFHLNEKFNHMNTLINEACLHQNIHVQNLIGSRSQTVPGWTMNITVGSPIPSSEDVHRKFKIMQKCFHPYTWWGDYSGQPSGYIRTKLNKCGKARLNFGNCYQNSDNVQVNLNNIEIGRAKGGVDNKTIEFEFKDGDILELRDIGVAAIKFNYFAIINCKIC